MKSPLYFLLITISLGLAAQSYADGHKKEGNKAKKNDPVAKAVKYRKGSFQMIKYHFAPLGAMVKEKAPFDADKAKFNAEAVATLSQFPLNGFKNKSLTEKSTAIPKIWEDWAGFKSGMEDFQKAAEKLSNSTSSLAEMKPAFLATAKTCKGCHDDYRKKKKK